MPEQLALRSAQPLPARLYLSVEGPCPEYTALAPIVSPGVAYPVGLCARFGAILGVGLQRNIPGRLTRYTLHAFFYQKAWSTRMQGLSNDVYL